MTDYLICFCDGGCNNKTKSGAYGSFSIRSELDYKLERLIFEDLESSNQAEYTIFIKLVERILESYPNGLTITIFSDSKLLVNQVNGLWRVTSPSIEVFYKTANFLFGTLSQLHEVRLVWTPRKNVVAELGH